jgi:hypothetical protein
VEQVLTTAESKSFSPAGTATPLGLALAKYCLKLACVLEDKTIAPLISVLIQYALFCLVIQIN